MVRFIDEDLTQRMSDYVIAQVTMHQRERTVIIRPYQNGLIVHTIYYPNEIHEVKEYGKDLPEKMKSQEIDLASQFAKALISKRRRKLRLTIGRENRRCPIIRFRDPLRI